jgi:hypothetical protein
MLLALFRAHWLPAPATTGSTAAVGFVHWAPSPSHVHTGTSLLPFPVVQPPRRPGAGVPSPPLQLEESLPFAPGPGAPPPPSLLPVPVPFTPLVDFHVEDGITGSRRGHGPGSAGHAPTAGPGRRAHSGWSGAGARAETTLAGFASGGIDWWRSPPRAGPQLEATPLPVAGPLPVTAVAVAACTTQPQADSEQLCLWQHDDGTLTVTMPVDDSSAPAPDRAVASCVIEPQGGAGAGAPVPAVRLRLGATEQGCLYSLRSSQAAA